MWKFTSDAGAEEWLVDAQRFLWAYPLFSSKAKLLNLDGFGPHSDWEAARKILLRGAWKGAGKTSEAKSVDLVFRWFASHPSIRGKAGARSTSAGS